MWKAFYGIMTLYADSDVIIFFRFNFYILVRCFFYFSIFFLLFFSFFFFVLKGNPHTGTSCVLVLQQCLLRLHVHTYIRVRQTDRQTETDMSIDRWINRYTDTYRQIREIDKIDIPFSAITEHICRFNHGLVAHRKKHA